MLNIWSYVRKINGFSTPFFGLQWNNEVDNLSFVIKNIAKEVIIFLEDRRVLYMEHNLEVPIYCIKSIEEIRVFLNAKLSEIPAPKCDDEITELELCLREMREACQVVLTRHQWNGSREEEHMYCNLGFYNEKDRVNEGIDFIMSLVVFRNVFALNISKISRLYNVKVRNERLNEIIESYVGKK